MPRCVLRLILIFALFSGAVLEGRAFVQSAKFFSFGITFASRTVLPVTAATTDGVECNIYGKILHRTDGRTLHRLGTTNTPFLYVGQFGIQTDPNGLHHMRARYYNPHLMRFLNADPIGFAGGSNWYSYAGNSPLLFIDPTGLCPSSNGGGNWFTNGINSAWSATKGAARGAWNWVRNVSYDDVSTGIHAGLSAGGTVPAFGVVPDAIDLIYTAVEMPFGKSDWKDLGLATVGIGTTFTPIAGDGAAAVAKVSYRVNKVAAKTGAQATEGIYQFTAASGKTYVGQSGNIASRSEQHLASGKLAPGTPVQTTEVLGGKTAREIAEQLRINELGGIRNLENIRNPIGPNRQYLLPPNP